MTKTSPRNFMFSERLEIHLKNNHDSLSSLFIYRPPGYTGPNFLNEFESFFLHIQAFNARNLFVGDFNTRFEDYSITERRNFIETLTGFQLLNYVDKPTFASGHTAK